MLLSEYHTHTCIKTLQIHTCVFLKLLSYITEHNNSSPNLTLGLSSSIQGLPLLTQKLGVHLIFHQKLLLDHLIPNCISLKQLFKSVVKTRKNTKLIIQSNKLREICINIFFEFSNVHLCIKGHEKFCS